jgi:Ser/Thr protein kinase RdoA (MazF antagonist)
LKTQNDHVPYANLNPNVILNAIEQAGFPCSGSLFALNSYENRVYQVGIEDSTPVIAKFYRPNRWTDFAILEEHQFAHELLALDIPVVAPITSDNQQTLHHFQEFRFSLFPRRGGHAIEVDNLEQLEWMGRFLGRLHAVGICKPFQHRLRLDVQTYGYHAYHFLINNHFIPEEIEKNYRATVETLLTLVESYFNSIENIRYIRLHGDCHAGNILWNDTGPHIVDLDDCLMGPAVQDIWMLLPGDSSQHEIELERILRGYSAFHDFNYSELRLIEPLRTLRMLHYSAWLAKRWEDPAFPSSFPWFNTLHYWREQLRDLQGQLNILQEGLHSQG